MALKNSSEVSVFAEMLLNPDTKKRSSARDIQRMMKMRAMVRELISSIREEKGHYQSDPQLNSSTDEEKEHYQNDPILNSSTDEEKEHYQNDQHLISSTD